MEKHTLKQISIKTYRLLQEYKALVELGLFIVAFLGISLPEWNSIWEHNLMAWYWPSRTVVVVCFLLLIVAYCTYQYISTLKSEIKALKTVKQYPQLTPERKAELVSKQFSDMGRFISALLNKKP